MPYLCPTCRSPIRAAATAGEGAWQCAHGHTITTAGGVLRLITPDFASALERFLPALRAYRDSIGRRLLGPAAYPALPFGPGAAGDREWQQRQYDLGVVSAALDCRPAATVLDVGAYNGWLSARLAARGLAVTGIDVFTDPFDGLGAHRHYPAAWRPVQLDLRDLSLLNEDYDLVIVNRCLAFFPDPAAALRQAQERVAAGGRLIALGLQVFADPSAKARQVAARAQAYQDRYGQPFFLWPTRGLLDGEDAARFRAAGLRLRRYPQLWWPDAKAIVRATLPRHYHGTWDAP